MGHPANDTGVGGASDFVICDVSVSLDGVFSALAPQHAGLGKGPVTEVRDLAGGQCRRIRNGAAEVAVNPASWSVKRLKIKEI